MRLAFERIRELTGMTDWDATREADIIYDQDPGFGFVFDEYVLSALASVSDELFERVRQLIGESQEETEQRMARFHARIGEFRNGV
jgi:hypothetical protein